MIGPPKCYERKCIHYLGVYCPEEGSEIGQVPHCTAFLYGIPNDISNGNNLHLKPINDQGNDIVFEKKRKIGTEPDPEWENEEHEATFNKLYPITARKGKL
jgi:hypothetical protein